MVNYEVFHIVLPRNPIPSPLQHVLKHVTQSLFSVPKETMHVLRLTQLYNIQGDSLARGPKLLSMKNYVSQLTVHELTTGYYQ